jgi:hypothetical protein
MILQGDNTLTLFKLNNNSSSLKELEMRKLRQLSDDATTNLKS